MKAYRITKNQFAADLSGEGARLYGGRWNRKGSPMLYFGENCSVVSMEYLVHVPLGILPKDLKLIEVRLPDIKIPKVAQLKLPDTWDSFPSSDLLAEIGSVWIQSKRSLMLKVPSAVSKGDFNILVNPLHPDIRKVKINSIKDYCFDARLFRENF